MDYGHVASSGAVDFLTALRAYLRECRSDTDLVTERESLPTIHDFIQYVSRPAVSRPIGDLLIGSHSHLRGQTGPMFDLDLESQTRHASSVTTADDLDRATRTGSVRLPNGVVRTGSVLWLLTCYCGLDWTFLHLFRQAVGIPYVRAPNAFAYHLWGARGGVFEFLCRGYSIVRVPTSDKEWADRPFTKYTDLLRAFAEAEFRFIDGTPVPAAKWRGWIRRDAADNLASVEYDVTVNLGETVAGRTTVPARRYWVPDPDEFKAEIPVQGRIPDSRGARMQLLHDYLARRPDFQIGHFYPMYRWRGFLSLEEFYRGFYWKFTPIQPGGRNVLQCIGRRFVYTVAPPLTRPGTDTLLFNFYPLKTSGRSPIIHLPYSNSTFFTTVGQ